MCSNSATSTLTSTTNHKQKVNNKTWLYIRNAIYVYKDRSITSIMIEVTSCHMECTHFNLDYSRMSAVGLHTYGSSLRAHTRVCTIFEYMGYKLT